MNLGTAGSSARDLRAGPTTFLPPYRKGENAQEQGEKKNENLDERKFKNAKPAKKLRINREEFLSNFKKNSRREKKGAKRDRGPCDGAKERPQSGERSRTPKNQGQSKEYLGENKTPTNNREAPSRCKTTRINGRHVHPR